MKSLFLSSRNQSFDQLVMEREKISTLVLMDRAVERLWKCFLQIGLPRFSSIAVWVGPGNNGGDGLGLALKCVQAGYPVDIYCPDLEKTRPSNEWTVQRNRLGDKVRFFPLSRFQAKSSLFVIDALYGAGFRGVLPLDVQRASAELQKFKDIQVWSIDVPSGFDGYACVASSGHVRAHKTFCIGYDKVVLHVPYLIPDRGDLHFLDIGCPLSEMKADVFLLDEEFVAQFNPLRTPLNAHKSSFGKLQMIAGSEKYPGAAVLCGLGAFKAGCGYVQIQNHSRWASQVILSALPELVLGWNSLSDAFVYGPGLSEETPEFVEILKSDKTLLIDGSGLRHLASLGVDRIRGKSHILLTPHEGEMAALLGCEVSEVAANRVAALMKLGAQLESVTILLKGSGTLIYDSGQIYLVPTGNVGMATAGQGDGLSGVLAAYLAAGMDAALAAKLGAFVHGFSGDCLVDSGIEQGILAHEVLGFYPRALKLVFEHVSEKSSKAQKIPKTSAEPETKILNRPSEEIKTR